MLRAVGSFDRQPVGMTAEQSSNREKYAAFTGYEASREAVSAIASRVAKAILAGEAPTIAKVR